MTPLPSAANAGLFVYISHAAEDGALLRELEEHLAPLKRDGRIRAWSSRPAGTGEDHRAQIEARIRAAQIIVLPVTAKFLASDELCKRELPLALDRAKSGGALVIPVLASECDWTKAPFAGLAPLPWDGTFIASRQDRAEAWREVSKGLCDAVEAQSGGRRDRPGSEVVTPPEPRYESAEDRAIAIQLEAAHWAREALRTAQASTAEVDAEILGLLRRLREGGRLRAGGTLGDGRYSLLELIGRGGFASVWRAFDRARGEEVALKVLHRELAGDPPRRERFFHSARVMSTLGHEAVVRVLDPRGEDDGYLYFTMELAAGGDLHRAVVKKQVLPENAMPLLLQVGEALAEAHAKGIAHRDVKPTNIVLDASLAPRVTDFDLVLLGDAIGGARTGMGTASYPYMAPEWASLAKEPDARADVYGLGMTSLFCLHGRELPAIVIRTPERVIADLQVNAAVKEVLTRAIEIEPGDRFADAKEFCAALRTATTHAKIRVPVEPPAPRRAGSLPPITPGMVINDRYDVRKGIGKGGVGEVYLAYDRSTQQTVALKVVREESRMPSDDEALRQELVLARSVRHPNICHFHDLTPSPWGPILVMEHIEGQSLYTHIRRRKAQGGYTADEFRKIAADICAGVAAIHAQGLVHGDLKPGNVMISERGAVILDFGFAKETARASARKPDGPPDGGTPNYMSPERLRSGGATAEDDVYAVALTLWEMWTCSVPEPGYKPREKTMRSQVQSDVPADLSVDEIKQIFCGLNEDPRMRPLARQMCFFRATELTSSVNLLRDRLDPGPPLGRGMASVFMPSSQALLVTYATNAPEMVGRLLPLAKPVMMLGRGVEQDLAIPEVTVSGAHAVVRWQAGPWLLEDLSSTNGSYADHSYERQSRIVLIHGGEVQVGECRLKLVRFDPTSLQGERARQYLARRDGLTGLLVRDQLIKAIDEDVRFSEWAEAPMQVARFAILGPDKRVSARPTILELLALRRVAQRVVELTETLLVSQTPAVAGRTGPLTFAVSIVGRSIDEGRHMVEHVVAQLQDLMPEALELAATLVTATPGASVRTLVDYTP